MAKKISISRRDFIQKVGTISTGLITVPVLGSSKKEEYDFVIVGSGAGGGPLACNLAKAGFRVLILEAGGEKINLREKIPALHALATEDPLISWNFFVKHYNKEVRQKDDSKFVKGKGILYPRASTLGGCTAHNALITMYPDNRDWDQIAKITGDYSWESSKMRHYFQKIEHCRYRSPSQGKKSRNGFKGWLSTEQTSYNLLAKDSQFFKIAAATARQEGLLNEAREIYSRSDFSLHLDPNDWRYVKNKTEGLVNVPKSTRDGQRVGPREYILETKKKYPQKLFIKTHCLATKIIFSDSIPNKAIGIEYLEGKSLYEASPGHSSSVNLKKTKRVFAGREVILCGGAFNSPQLLMLSGIGDTKELEKLKIRPKVHLPGVGKNLQDRYEVGVVSELKSPFHSLSQCTFLKPEDPCFLEYHKNPKTSLYSSNGLLIGLIKKSFSYKKDPDLFIFGVPGQFKGYYPGWSKDATAKNDVFTWLILKGHTHNRAGYVKLKSNNPTHTPEINFNYFDEGNGDFMNDLKGVVKGMKIAREINNTIPLKGLIKKEIFPGPSFKDERFLKDYVLEESWGHHASCTNKIGNKKDPMAVLDSKFKVKGTQGLRVVDASVFPRIPGLFIALPIYMVAEKASHDILKDHGKLI
jgi:choline dehydrogenase